MYTDAFRDMVKVAGIWQHSAHVRRERAQYSTADSYCYIHSTPTVNSAGNSQVYWSDDSIKITDGYGANLTFLHTV